MFPDPKATKQKELVSFMLIGPFPSVSGTVLSLLPRVMKVAVELPTDGTQCMTLILLAATGSTGSSVVTVSTLLSSILY